MKMNVNESQKKISDFIKLDYDQQIIELDKMNKNKKTIFKSKRSAFNEHKRNNLPVKSIISTNEIKSTFTGNNDYEINIKQNDSVQYVTPQDTNMYNPLYHIYQSQSPVLFTPTMNPYLYYHTHPIIPNNYVNNMSNIYNNQIKNIGKDNFDEDVKNKDIETKNIKNNEIDDVISYDSKTEQKEKKKKTIKKKMENTTETNEIMEKIKKYIPFMPQMKEDTKTEHGKKKIKDNIYNYEIHNFTIESLEFNDKRILGNFPTIFGKRFLHQINLDYPDINISKYKLRELINSWKKLNSFIQSEIFGIPLINISRTFTKSIISLFEYNKCQNSVFKLLITIINNIIEIIKNSEYKNILSIHILKNNYKIHLILSLI